MQNSVHRGIYNSTIPAELTAHKCCFTMIFIILNLFIIYACLSNMNACSTNIYAPIYALTHKTKLQINSALDN